MNEPTVGYEDEFFNHDSEYAEGDHEERDCFHCSGDGWVECDDPIQCTYPHRIINGNDGEFSFQMCPCASCGGSGLAKDMTIW